MTAYEEPVPMSRDQVETIRRSLVLEGKVKSPQQGIHYTSIIGMTYGEWCCQKRREYELSEANVYLPSPRRAKEPIKETACFNIIAD